MVLAELLLYLVRALVVLRQPGELVVEDVRQTLEENEREDVLLLLRGVDKTADLAGGLPQPAHSVFTSRARFAEATGFSQEGGVPVAAAALPLHAGGSLHATVRASCPAASRRHTDLPTAPARARGPYVLIDAEPP